MSEISDELKGKLIDWLCSEYTEHQATDQIMNAKITKENVYVIEYASGKKDIVKVVGGHIAQIS